MTWIFHGFVEVVPYSGRLEQASMFSSSASNQPGIHDPVDMMGHFVLEFIDNIVQITEYVQPCGPIGAEIHDGLRDATVKNEETMDHRLQLLISAKAQARDHGECTLQFRNGRMSLFSVVPQHIGIYGVGIKLGVPDQPGNGMREAVEPSKRDG
jgi:hypothetical protein